MAEGGAGSFSGDPYDVVHLLTPLSAMAISCAGPRRPKRQYTSRTGQTPTAKLKRVSARSRFSSRRRLSFVRSSPENNLEDRDGIPSTSNAPPAEPWSDSETKALLEFLLFHKGPETKWFKRDTSKDFWIAAVRFVQTRVKTPLPRSCM